MSNAMEAAIDRLHQRIARLEGVAARPVPRPIQHVADTVALHFGIKRVDLMGQARAAHVSLARHVAMHLVRDLHGLSFPRIGRAFGRDHTSVMHGYRRVERLLATDPQLAAQWEALADVLSPDRCETPSQTPTKED